LGGGRKHGDAEKLQLIIWTDLWEWIIQTYQREQLTSYGRLALLLDTITAKEMDTSRNTKYSFFLPFYWRLCAL